MGGNINQRPYELPADPGPTWSGGGGIILLARNQQFIMSMWLVHEHEHERGKGRERVRVDGLKFLQLWPVD